MALLRWAALVAAAMMLAPATALALPLPDQAPQVLASPPGLGAAADAQAALLDLAGNLGPSVRPGDALLRIGTQSTGATAPALPPMSFDEALAALYATAGLPAPGADAAPPAPLAEALAPVVAATAVAATLTQQAFAGLSGEEQAFLWTHFLSPASLEDPEGSAADQARVGALAARVDMPRIQLGSAILANAMAAFQPPAGPSARAWSDPTGFIEVLGTGDDGVCPLASPILIIDLGGNDYYCGHPASVTPWTSGSDIPVRAILDVHGNDLYHNDRVYPWESPTTGWGNGVGLGGIGLLVDRTGDDRYVSVLNDVVQPPTCFQTLYGQGVGGLGVGAIIDASGNDLYYAYNVNTLASSCHFGWVYSFVQATALAGGVGAILDYTGDDAYAMYSESAGKADNLAHVYAQGAASGGVAALVDEEGNDLYHLNLYAHPGPIGTQIKGDFAYAIAQGATFATRMAHSALPAVPAVPGLGDRCFEVPLGVAYNLLCIYDFGQGSTEVAPTLAVLADLVGRDTFEVYARASDLSRGCVYVWAVSSAQGSAAIPGSVAALLNLDVSDADTFLAQPIATGYCYNGVRAFSYGQGFGGPIQLPFYDSPRPDDGPAIGILASAGPVRTCPPSQGNQAAAVPGLPFPAVPGGGTVQELLGGLLGPRGIEVPGAGDVSPCRAVESALGPGAVPGSDVVNSPDRYGSYPYALNWRGGCGGCVAQAESWVQGSAARDTTAYPTHQVLGVGLNFDAGGDDAYVSCPTVWGTPPGASLRSVAQGASDRGVGALVNAGGDDIYSARSCGANPGTVQRFAAQGIGDGNVAVPPQTVNPPLDPVVTQPVSVPGVGEVLPAQQVGLESLSWPGTTVPPIKYGSINVPPDPVNVPGFGPLTPEPVNTDPINVGGMDVLPGQTLDPFQDVTTPAQDAAPSVGIIIDLGGSNDWYSQAAGAGPLVPCYGNTGYGPNGQTLGSLFALVTDARVWTDDVTIIPTTCPTPSTGFGLGIDWASDLGI